MTISKDRTACERHHSRRRQPGCRELFLAADGRDKLEQAGEGGESDVNSICHPNKAYNTNTIT